MTLLSIKLANMNAVMNGFKTLWKKYKFKLIIILFSLAIQLYLVTFILLSLPKIADSGIRLALISIAVAFGFNIGSMFTEIENARQLDRIENQLKQLCKPVQSVAVSPEPSSFALGLNKIIEGIDLLIHKRPSNT